MLKAEVRGPVSLTELGFLVVSYMHSMHGDWLALPFHDPYKQ